MKTTTKRSSKEFFYSYLLDNRGIQIVVILLILITVGVYVYKIQKPSDSFITTFDECVKSNGREIIQTYPRRCNTVDKITYIEKLPDPIDTSGWSIFNVIPGFSFKCPPGWNCKKFDDMSAIISENHYSNISTFQINLITPRNFQRSFIRHPNYRTPVVWLNDVLAKKVSAVTALPSTIESAPGTDGLSYPAYYSYDLNKMMEIHTTSGVTGVIFPPGNEHIPDANVIIPLNTTDVAFVLLSPTYLINDPVIKGILTSIQ